MTIEMGCPLQALTIWVSCFLEEIFSPFSERMTSPSRTPASSAGFTAWLCRLVTDPVPTTMTPSVTILMPNGVPHSDTTLRSTTWTLTSLMSMSPSRRSFI